MKNYHMLDEEEKKGHARLLALEINGFLKKAYKAMKPKTHLAASSISASDIKLKHASLGAAKMWEFKLSPRDSVAKGSVGKVVVATRGLDDEAIRKQRALFIAAEWYVYHAFANHPDKSYFNRIKSQNMYANVMKAMFSIKNAQTLRDQAVRYVIEEIGEHKLAHYLPDGWMLGIAELKEYDDDLAKLLGSSEKTFKDILRKQKQRFSPKMLKGEEDLVRKEIEDLEELLELLKRHEKTKGPQKRLIDIHIADIKTFLKILHRILHDIDKWVVADRKEHKLLKKTKAMTRKDMEKILSAEAEAEQIDINKIHVIFHHFKKEKINILQDMELIESAGVKRQKRRHK